jgi:nucleoside-diphosphate-sugar epimerase
MGTGDQPGNWTSRVLAMTRYFITGAQGFVGRYLVSYILGADPYSEVLGIGRSPVSHDTFTHSVRWGARCVRAPIPVPLGSFVDSRYIYLSIDLNDAEALTRALARFRPNSIIHLASGLRDDAAEFLVETNIGGTTRLLEAVTRAGISPATLVLGSTGGVYGIPRALPISESMPCSPIDPYSATKLAAEQMARIVGRRHGLPLICARLFNIMGPGQDERHICGHFASQAVAIAAGLTAPVMQAESLQTTRDFIDVRDAAAALYLIANYGRAGAIYNVANGCEIPMHSILRLTLNTLRIDEFVHVRHGRIRSVDIPRHVASIANLRRLGYQQRYRLQESVSDIIDYYEREVAGAAQPSRGRTVRVA